MELGQRIRQARQEAGLSQRQLCGDKITRNMLSQIENGSARPSMDTLRYLAAQLGKPVGFFLEEQAVTSPNQAVMEAARQQRGEQVLEVLSGYRENDPVFDRERWLMEALACMEAARQAIGKNQPGYALALLERCAEAGEKTPYYTPALERERLLTWYEADAAAAPALETLLAEDSRESLLRAQGALDRGEWEQAARFLHTVTQQDDAWHWLMGRCAMASRDYAAAVALLEKIQAPTMQTYAALERCCKEIEDYKKAYEYACKQR